MIVLEPEGVLMATKNKRRYQVCSTGWKQEWNNMVCQQVGAGSVHNYVVYMHM